MNLINCIVVVKVINSIEWNYIYEMIQLLLCQNDSGFTTVVMQWLEWKNSAKIQSIQILFNNGYASISYIYQTSRVQFCFEKAS